MSENHSISYLQKSDHIEVVHLSLSIQIESLLFQTERGK